MKVVVTGGKGSVGKPLVAHLVRQGYQVKVIDRSNVPDVEGADYVQCDVVNYAALREELRGCDKIIHLAAVPNPALAEGQELFRINCCSAYNVFEAAAAEGIRQVVCASSINALGYYYGSRRFAIEYLPIDEGHPACITDPYSFSKQVTEEIAAYYWRREGISSLCLRLPGVYTVNDATRSHLVERFKTVRRTAQEIVNLPEAERREWVDHMLTRSAELSAARYLETPPDASQISPDPEVFLLNHRCNFFANIDALDAATAFELAMHAQVQGSLPIYVNDSQNITGIPSEILAEVFFPATQRRSRPLKGTESLVSIDRARALLGFEPKFSLSSWL